MDLRYFFTTACSWLDWTYPLFFYMATWYSDRDRTGNVLFLLFFFIYFAWLSQHYKGTDIQVAYIPYCSYIYSAVIFFAILAF